MAADILGLTGTEEIRSILGLSIMDAADQHFLDFGLEADLEADLLDWRSDYATIITDGTEGTPTADQRRSYLILRKYAKYFCAYQVIISAESFIAQMVSDGNSQFKRYAADWDKIRERIAGILSAAKDELIELIDAITASPHTIMGKSTPDYDPVAHE